MKPLLMHRDRDFDLQGALPWNEQDLTQDLELGTLFETMAHGDAFLKDMARRGILASATDPSSIVYRQDVLKDCLDKPAVVHAIYEIAVDAIEGERKNHWGLVMGYPDSVLRRSVDVMGLFIVSLKKLRAFGESHAGNFSSAGFRTFFAMLASELGDDYFAEVQEHLKELKFWNGVLVSAELGAGNKGVNYVLRKPLDIDRGWIRRIFARKVPSYSYQLASRDENGARALSELRDRGLNLAANALAQSNDHILSFFRQLRAELAFYLGCLNLNKRLSELDEPVCFPEPVAQTEHRHIVAGLYDICLALTKGQRVVGNDLDANGKDMVVITGANQGGKSTFLRGVGLAQLMMQCGMFAPAQSLRASVCDSVITHYRREEDATMKSGKLDEELTRMSDIVDHATCGSMVLFNESFAATNEREGSQIATQIVNALTEAGIKVFFVTHLYEFAHDLHNTERPDVKFLRAERQADGTRTFRLNEGEPLQTSYGEDLYHRIFETPSTGHELRQ
ncbi:DNA mismatch repair protein MutS [Mesorhizobium qingshengii]|uniref:DNA mismatch repair protein MutS n=1 Tax=Mesorhizobium qingshengii TaxID=1165689 RepID=A0ABT4QYC8_9HYPH|nr:DNA mismatch repair protein MutS [Mesorhizobium qingshengii]MCZ8546399.1 DNA mismatch repair protein MutS [Mesorhizobium qingshengii]